MITRNGLISIIVLLAGFSTGYIFSRTDLFQGREISEVSQYGISRFEKCRSMKLEVGMEMDVIRLERYYRQFSDFYLQWIDKGDLEASTKYKLALGQFSATLKYLQDKYGEDLCFTAGELDFFQREINMAEQSERTIRWAKLVLVILVFLLLMGIPGLIRHSGHRKFAASLYYDSLFRPHMVSDLNSWHNTRRLVFILLLLYLLTPVIFFSFVSWEEALAAGAVGLIPIFVLTGTAGKYRKWPEMLISFTAPDILIIVLLLCMVAVRGPMFLWYRLCTIELFRTLFMALLFMLVFRKIHLYLILEHKWSHRMKIWSAVMVALALGLQLISIWGLTRLILPSNLLSYYVYVL